LDTLAEGVAPPRIDFEAEATHCPVCRGHLVQYKTTQKTVLDIPIGSFQAHHILKVCPQHRHLDLDGPPRVRSFASAELTRMVPAGAGYTYRLLVAVGMMRFRQAMQIVEIQEELAARFGRDLSHSQISCLAERFLLYFQCVHEQTVPEIIDEMNRQGGWVLHVDSTGEAGERIFACMAVYRDGPIVLTAHHIVTEATDRLVKVLKPARRCFGRPLAVMRDMAKGERDALLLSFPKSPQRVCHWHFLDDLGSDILKKPHDQLRDLLRRTKVRASLRKLRRQLALELHGADCQVRNYKAFLQQHKDKPVELLWALATWTLDYRSQAGGLACPFHLPYLAFYYRLRQAQKHLAVIGRLPKTRKIRQWTMRFRRCLRKLFDEQIQGQSVPVAVESLERLNAIFDRMRRILRVDKKSSDPEAVAPANPRQQARQSKRELGKFHKLANKSAGNRRYGTEVQRAYRLVAQHIDDHGPDLFLPEHSYRRRVFPDWAVADRTNNALEGLFGRCKRGIRRATGKKSLLQEFAAHGPQRILVQNLKSPAYMRIVYGSQDRLAARFAQVPEKIVLEAAAAMAQVRKSPERPLKRKHIRNEDLENALEHALAVSITDDKQAPEAAPAAERHRI
jgi:hypothetical protein